MKGLILGAGLVLLAGQMAFATTTDVLEISTGGQSAKIADNGACTNVGVGTLCSTLSSDTNSSDGTVTINGSVGGWTLSFVSGTSNSPALTPDGIDIGALTASCKGLCSGTNSLDIAFSDIGFTASTPEFKTFYSATITGSGSTSESAYYSNTNLLFAETTLIGTVGPLTAPGGSGSAVGGAGSTPDYSLTLDAVFTAPDCSGCTTNSSSFSVDGNITGVPEPASILLLGGVVFMTTKALRRRRSA